MIDFQQFLEVLWSQKASGEGGFEGLVRKLLERITGQRFFLSASGRQEGRDMAGGRSSGNLVAAECKRYKEGTSLGSDELLTKFIRVATSVHPPDIWIVVTTKRLHEQHDRDLRNASDQYGISYFAIDAEGGEESWLAALSTFSPEVVASHLKANPPTIDDSTAEEIARYLSNLALGVAVSRTQARLRDALLHDTIGYADWRSKQNRWLADRLESSKESFASFTQDFAVRAPGRQLVIRNRAQRAVDDWWAAWRHERRPLAILGEEGDGKSWVVVDWLADKLKQEDFPPVLFVSCTQLDEAAPMELAIQALQRQLGEARTDYWLKHLHRWFDHPSDTGPVFVMVLDGLNERPGLKWPLLLSRLEVSPLGNQVAVIMTCRTLFWGERLDGLVGNCVTCNLEPYDEDELTRALNQQGYERGDFDDKLLPLLKKPRYFDLAVKLRVRLLEQGEVTVERLIYEDWRDQISRKRGNSEPLTNDEFQELISGLSGRWQSQGNLRREDVYAELGLYGDSKALLDELKIGRVLRKDGNNWVVDPHYLVLGLGLLLAEEVRQALKGNEAMMEELIATRLEPQRDMDLKVSICGMAFLHALHREDYPDVCRMALFHAWIRGRNIQPEDWRRVPAYLPLRPSVYLLMAEYLWGAAGENREAQDAFMAGFIRFGAKDTVRAVLVPAFERWMGFVHPDGHQGRRAQDEDGRKKGREAVCDALGAEREAGFFDLFGYHLELTREEGWLRLAAVALAVISHQKREPYLRAMATGALAGAVMGYPGYESTFNWVLRTAPDAIEVPLLEMAQELMALETPTAQKAGWWLLSGLCTEAALELRNQILPKYGYKNALRELYEENPCGGVYLWGRDTYKRCLEESQFHPTRIAEQLREVVLDPILELPDGLPLKLDLAGEGMDLNNVRSALGTTAEDLAMEQMEPALCACHPERLVEILSALAFKLPERTGGRCHWLAWIVYEHLLVMGDDERKAIEQTWRTILESGSEEDKNAEYVLFPCVLWGRPAEVQLDLIEQRGNRNGYFTEYPPRIAMLENSDLPMVAARLECLAQQDCQNSYNLLWLLAHALPKLDNPIRKAMLRLFREGDSVIRGLCLQIFINTKDDKACRSLVNEGWRFDEVMGDYERHWGSRLLCEQGAEIPFAEIADRVWPAFLGYAVQCRGNRQGEVVAHGELIHEIWCGIAARQPDNYKGADYTTIEVNRVDRSEEPGSWKISDGDPGGLHFVSWDSIWGGGAEKGNIDDLREAPDINAQINRVNEANRRLRRLVDIEQQAGNPWFLNAFDRSALVDVISAFPGYVNQWLHAASQDTPGANTLLARCRGFYEKLCDVLLDQEPEQGLRLFWRLRTRNAFHLSDRTTSIDSLLFSPFAAKDSEQVVQLRHHLFDSCTTDKCLFEFAFLMQLYNRHDELLQVVDAWLTSQQPFDRARGLTLLGFMDVPAAGERLNEWIDTHRQSWIRSGAEVALRAHQRNQWARHWFKIFLTHEEDLRAWAAFRLFLRCVDRRCWLWGPEMAENGAATSVRIDHYRANREQIRKAAVKNEKDVLKLEKQFVGNTIRENQVWPWMSRYLELDVGA